MKFFSFLRSLSLIFLTQSVIFSPAAHCKETTLTKEIEMPILANGQQIGTIKLPVGSTVTLLSVGSDGVMISRGEGKSRPLMLAFLRSVIGQRLPPLSASQSSSTPTHLSSSDGWLGNPLTYEIASNANYQGSRSEAIWLPDQATAQAWQSFLKDQ